jgi:hypothetical protein
LNTTDISKLTWPLNVAIAGTAFAVFSVINDPYYINYGFITMLFGVLAHYTDLIGQQMQNRSKQLKFVFGVQGALIVGWVITLLLIY